MVSVQFLSTTMTSLLSSSLNLSSSSSSSSDRVPWTFGEKVFIVSFYSASILLSSIGNLLVLVVFWIGSVRFGGTQTRTGGEVKRFLTSLAVSDLLISLFCVPFTFTNILLWEWPFPGPLCPIVLAIQVLAVTASVITNMAIGLDRFWVVLYPMRSRITRRRSGLVILAIWICSIFFSSVQLVVARAHRMPDGHVECEEKWNDETLQILYTLFILVLTYVTPLLVLLVTYSIVALKLWRRALPGEADTVRDANHMRSKLKVIKMLAIIVICFGLCWLPLQLFFVVAHTTQFHGYSKYNINVAYVVCHWIAMTNSCVNPVVYGIMNDSFRSDLKWLFVQKCSEMCGIHVKEARGTHSISGKDSVSNLHSSVLGTNHHKSKLSTVRFNGHQDKDQGMEELPKRPGKDLEVSLSQNSLLTLHKETMPILNPHFKDSFRRKENMLQIVTQL